MKRSLSFTTAILAAFLALSLLASTVRSEPLTDRGGPAPLPAVISPERAPLSTDVQARTSGIQSTAEFSLTRMVTATIGSSTVPLTPGLNSRWQINIIIQEPLPGIFRLPSDASDITVTLVNGEYSIDYSGPTIYVTNSQGIYYEYRTDQQAQRFGNQILITQSYRFNRPLHYVGTVIFTDPYHYLGYVGYAPTQTNATQLHWDASFTQTQLNEFKADTWLVDTGLPDIRPDLEIATATLLSQLNHVYVTAGIRNNGPITAWAPVYINLYDRIAASVPPTGPLDLADGWCTLSPFSWCGGVNNPLSAIPSGQTVIFTAQHDLPAVNGVHDIYLLVDALGTGNALGDGIDQGLNVESAENNNVKLVGSVMRWSAFVFLPLVRR
ncbi:hypothetical protein TFLX_05502 [Thermoflexales bacterium]|nr:hypothetical protein TFLX_05502 [Thermoflexales bacterium]